MMGTEAKSVYTRGKLGEERRSAPRARAYLPVRLQKPSSPQVVETLTKDLAAGGMRCLSPSLVPVSSDVNIELMLSGGEEPLVVRGTAIWFRTLPQSEQFDLGIAFKGLDPRNKRRLSAYLDRLVIKPVSVLV